MGDGWMMHPGTPSMKRYRVLRILKILKIFNMLKIFKNFTIFKKNLQTERLPMTSSRLVLITLLKYRLIILTFSNIFQFPIYFSFSQFTNLLYDCFTVTAKFHLYYYRLAAEGRVKNIVNIFVYKFKQNQISEQGFLLEPP